MKKLLIVLLGFSLIFVPVGVKGAGGGGSDDPDLPDDEQYNEGWNDGYLVGYDDGHIEGYDDGLIDGYDDGYDVGYDEGYEAGPEMNILLIILIMYILSMFLFFKFRIKWILISTILLWFVPIFLVENLFIKIFCVIMILATITITFFNEREEY